MNYFSYLLAKKIRGQDVYLSVAKNLDKVLNYSEASLYLFYLYLDLPRDIEK